MSSFAAPCWGTDSETFEAFLSPFAATFSAERPPLEVPLVCWRLEVSIFGALSSVSQLHYKAVSVSGIQSSYGFVLVKVEKDHVP